MATIKSYTTIEQSRKLAEFLPLESTDMYYVLSEDESTNMISFGKSQGFFDRTQVAWSLAALVDVLPSATLDSSSDHYYRLHCMTKYTEWYDNPIDACVEMILKLHELNLL